MPHFWQNSLLPAKFAMLPQRKTDFPDDLSRDISKYSKIDDIICARRNYNISLYIVPGKIPRILRDRVIGQIAHARHTLSNLTETLCTAGWNYKDFPGCSVMVYKLQTSLNHLSNSVNTFYIMSSRMHVCTYMREYRCITR